VSCRFWLQCSRTFSVYLTSVLIYTFLNLDTYHLVTPCLHERRCEVTWLFSEAKGGPRAKTFGKQWSRSLPSLCNHSAFIGLRSILLTVATTGASRELKVKPVVQVLKALTALLTDCIQYSSDLLFHICEFISSFCRDHSNKPGCANFPVLLLL